MSQDEDHHHHEYTPLSAAAVVSDLWDEFWFFQNCLTDGRPKVVFSPKPPPASTPASQLSRAGPALSSVSPTQANNKEQPLASAVAAPSAAPPRQSLLRAPSLPPDISNHHQSRQDEDGHHPMQSVPKKKLLRSYSSTQDQRPHSSSSSCKACLIPSRPHRPPRDFTLEARWVAPNKATYRHCHRHHHYYNTCQTPEAGRVAFQVKKWKSLTDLEHEEVQGFKDLGFVFDNTHGQLSPVLLKMIPGLRTGVESSPDDGRTAGGVGDDSTPVDVTRPYLSEAWLMQRSAPPALLGWDSRGVGSPAHMKEKLRFWARAVASNVRQEC